MSRWLAVSALCFASCLAGCTGSARVEAPEFDAEGIASGAMAAYDSDSDGELSKSECKTSPFALDRWDADSDGAITEDEIQSRIEKYIEKGLGMLDVTCRVTLNGRPLENANVEFVPEEYMGGAIKAAEATTDIDGLGTPAVPEIVAEDPVLTGLQPGLYRIRVTHSEIKLAARYNEASTLTFDASPFDVVFEAIPIKLRK